MASVARWRNRLAETCTLCFDIGMLGPLYDFTSTDQLKLPGRMNKIGKVVEIVGGPMPAEGHKAIGRRSSIDV